MSTDWVGNRQSALPLRTALHADSFTLSYERTPVYFFYIIKMLGPSKLETHVPKLWKISSLNLFVIFLFAKTIFFLISEMCYSVIELPRLNL